MIILNPTCRRLNHIRFWLFHFVEFSKYMYVIGFIKDFFFYKFLNYFNNFFKKKLFSFRILYFFFKKYNLFFLNKFNFLLKKKPKFRLNLVLKKFIRDLKEKASLFFFNLFKFFKLKKNKLKSLNCFLIKSRNDNKPNKKNIKFPFYIFFIKFFAISRLSFINLIDHFFLIFKLKGRNLRYFFFNKFFNMKRKFVLLDYLNFLKLKKKKEKKLNLIRKFTKRHTKA